MRIYSALCATLLSAALLSPMAHAQATGFSDMSPAETQAAADKAAAAHDAAVKAAADRIAADADAASRATAEAQAAADKAAAEHAAAVKAAAARVAADDAAASRATAEAQAAADKASAAHAAAVKAAIDRVAADNATADANATTDKASAEHAAAVKAAAARVAAADAAASRAAAKAQAAADKASAAHAAAVKAALDRVAADNAAADRAAANAEAARRALVIRADAARAARAAALLPPAPIKLPEFKTPEEVFAYTRTLNDPEAAGVPFHAKATFVASGDAEFIGNGTYEEWWQSKDVWRKEATLGGYKYVAIHNGNSEAATATSVYTPLRVWQAMNLQLFHIGQTEEKQPKWMLSTITRNSGHLIEVQQHRPCSPEKDSPTCIDQYVFSPRGVLKSYSENDLLQSYSNAQPFLQFQVARRVVIALHGNQILTLQIVSLQPLAAGDQALLEVKSLPNDSAIPAKVFPGEMPDSVVLPTVLTRAPMEFPKLQQGQIHSSTVVMECMIDPSGTPREPYVKSSGGKEYDRQAIKNLLQWKFAPGTLDGQPIVVKIVIVSGFTVKK